MGKKNRSKDKQIYKQSKQRVYVKGSKQARQEMLSDRAARIVAMLFYPIYLLVVKCIGLKKQIKQKFDGSQINNKLKQTSKQTSKQVYKKNPSQTSKATVFFNTVKDKWAGLLENGKAKASNLSVPKLAFLENGTGGGIKFERIKAIGKRYLAYVNRHRIVFSGVIAVLAIGIIGFNAMANLTPENKLTTKEAANSAQVVAVGDSTNGLEPLTSKPTLEDIGFASIRTYEIVVNDQIIAHFKTKDECETVLDNLMAMYTSDTESEIIESYFAEQVEIVYGFESVLKFDGYDDIDEMLSYIVKGTKEEKIHVVEKGENYWVIANYYGISPYDLEAANPTVKAETLQIGQEISLVVPKPIIGVCTVEKASYNDTIAYDVTYEDNANLYQGESSVKVKGVEGERAVVAEIVKENGREINRTILEEEVLSEPTTKVVYQGTKEPPPRMGTGVLKRPTSRGSITSGFGYRWGTRHNGIDIGIPVGTEVHAADGGVVTFAGYSSSYGYYVMIDHGGNVVTLYAHNSKLVVSKGDKVYQGQLISYSGNTGRSTGPHLHFEVRINGTPVNPTGYVSY